MLGRVGRGGGVGGGVEEGVVHVHEMLNDVFRNSVFVGDHVDSFSMNDDAPKF